MSGRICGYLRENVLGLVAIFLALNAGAYAVNSEKRGKSADLGGVNHEIEARDIAPKAINEHKLRLGSVGKVVQRRTPGGGCEPGEAIRKLKRNGEPICIAAEGKGTITNIATSGGLTGGGGEGNIALGVNPQVIQTRVSGECNAGEAVQSVNQDGSVNCLATGTGDGTVSSVGSGFGLTGGPITDAGVLEADPSVLQQRVGGNCTGDRAITSINQNGGVNCSSVFENASDIPSVVRNLTPGSPEVVLFERGEIRVIASCVDDATDRAVVEIEAEGAGVGVNWMVVAGGVDAGTVDPGNRITLVDTASMQHLTLNSFARNFANQLDASLGVIAPGTGGGVCHFFGSAILR